MFNYQEIWRVCILQQRASVHSSSSGCAALSLKNEKGRELSCSDAAEEEKETEFNELTVPSDMRHWPFLSTLSEWHKISSVKYAVAEEWILKTNKLNTSTTKILWIHCVWTFYDGSNYNSDKYFLIMLSTSLHEPCYFLNAYHTYQSHLTSAGE